MKWHTEIRKISELKEWENNPRTISEESYKELKESINDLGNFEPLVINIDGTVLAGNQRLRIHKERGDKEVEVSVPERELTEEEIKKIGIISNRHSGEWDMDKLANEFEDVLTELGFDDLLPEVELEVKEDDYEEPEDLETTVVLGDIYQLGEHRLMCGDSTKIEDVEKLMNGQTSTLLHADPPYGMGKEKDGVLNDNLYADKLDAFQMEWWKTFRPYLFNNASAYIWGNAEDLWRLWYKGGLKDSERLTFRNQITWDKYVGNVKPTKIEMMRSYVNYREDCLFFMLGEQGFNNNSDNYWGGWDAILNYLQGQAATAGLNAGDIKRITGVGMYSHWFTKSQWTFITEDNYKKLQEYCRTQNQDAFKKDYDELKKDYDELKQEFYATRAYFDNTHDNMTDVWKFESVKGAERHDHATPKPVEMIARIIKSSSKENDIVIEPFGGSGSTLIACEQTNRKCYMMEIDPYYCQVIIDRWEKFTGKEAIKLED